MYPCKIIGWTGRQGATGMPGATGILRIGLCFCSS